MPEWFMWALIAAVVAAGILLLGKGQLSTRTGMHNRSERYDPVHLQREESMYIPAEPPHKE